MSGGTYDYICHKLSNVVDDIRDNGECGAASPELRKLFKEHLRLVAKTLRAIEWNDSGDGDDDEESLIRECLKIGNNRTLTATKIDLNYYKPGTKVILGFSTDLDSNGHWYIATVEDHDFWLYAYSFKYEAKAVCDFQGWIIVNPS